MNISKIGRNGDLPTLSDFRRSVPVSEPQVFRRVGIAHRITRGSRGYLKKKD